MLYKRSFVAHLYKGKIAGLFKEFVIKNSSRNQSPANPMTAFIGYARVSTQDQDLSLQRDALRKADCQLIYEEKVSSAKAERSELEQCLKALRSGDTLVVWRMDRLGRSLKELVDIVTSLEARGVGFESLTERIETRTPSGKLMFHVFGALAEFERNLIRERTMAGLAAARARGRVGGRKEKLTEQQKKEIRVLLANPDIQVKYVAERYGVSRNTLYRSVGVVRVMGGTYTQPEENGEQDVGR